MPVMLATALWLAVASAAVPVDEECLACHGQQGMQSASGRSIYVDIGKHKASVHGGVGCTACHVGVRQYPHPKRMPKVSCASCHAQPATEVPKSAHRALGAQACVSCHGAAHEAPRATRVSPQQCASCHGEIARDFQASVHGVARTAGAADSPTCQSCHGPTHKVLPARDLASPVAKRNLPNTCGSCHANPEFLARHQIPFARPVEAYRLSVHGRALARGNTSAPSCSDCHSNHAIFAARDPVSMINHWNVARTCGTCHLQIKMTYQRSIHGQAVQRGVPDAPVCTDCHGEHTILAPSEPQSLVSPARVSSVTCGRCHADERLTQRYNLPADKVPAYADSYHGLALRSGALTVANCASCHGVHDILPSSNPRSSVHPANLARTCGSCHPGAGERFAIGPVHVRASTASEHVAVRWIRVAYWILIPLLVAFMVLHNAVDFLAKLIRHRPRADSGEQVSRMSLHFRIAHGLVVLSFLVLVITGFALKFPESWWAQPLLRWESRFALRGTVHRAAGAVLLASLVYHAVHLVMSRRDRIILRFLRPGIRDAREFWAALRYNLGLSDQRPQFGKFNYAEKIEYLAFVWGMVVMSASGFLLWFNNFTLRHFPKWVADAATAIHYYEAILATLSILVWHFYMTIFDPDVYPMDRAWLTGKTSADHLRHTRPAYYLEVLREQRLRESPEEPEEMVPPGQEGAARNAATASGIREAERRGTQKTSGSSATPLPTKRADPEPPRSKR